MKEIVQGIWERLRHVYLNQFVSSLLIVSAIGVAIGILAQEGPQLLRHSFSLNVPLLILSFLITCVGMLIAALAWHQIVKKFGVSGSFRDSLRIYCYSLLGYVLPGGIWSVVGRTAFYQRVGVHQFQVVTASTFEAFVVGLAALGVCAVFTLIHPGPDLWQRPEIGFSFSCLILIFLHPNIFKRLSRWLLKKSKIKDEVILPDFHFKDLATWLGLEAVVVIIGGVAAFMLLASLTSPPLEAMFLTIMSWAIAVSVSSLFFWLPGTPVLRDGAMILALSSIVSHPIAILYVLLLRIWSVMSLLFFAGGVWLIVDFPKYYLK